MDQLKLEINLAVCFLQNYFEFSHWGPCENYSESIHMVLYIWEPQNVYDKFGKVLIIFRKIIHTWSYTCYFLHTLL